ncbi:hypothetical protein L1887_05717 [Cichorium endivia]|nr:hypothetical protein L1887_05717 [Cichorium endivia]
MTKVVGVRLQGQDPSQFPRKEVGHTMWARPIAPRGGLAPGLIKDVVERLWTLDEAAHNNMRKRLDNVFITMDELIKDHKRNEKLQWMCRERLRDGSDSKSSILFLLQTPRFINLSTRTTLSNVFVILLWAASSKVQRRSTTSLINPGA